MKLRRLFFSWNAQTPRIDCLGKIFSRCVVVQTSRIQGYHSFTFCFVFSSFFFSFFFLEICARDFYKNQLQQGSILLTGNMLCSQDNMQQLYKEYNAADSNMSHSWCFRDPTDRKHFFLFLFGWYMWGQKLKSWMHLQLECCNYHLLVGLLNVGAVPQLG